MAPTDEFPAEGHRSGGAECHEAKPAPDTTRAELSGIAAELDNAATERITLLEQFLDFVTAEGQAIGERVRGFDVADTWAHG